MLLPINFPHIHNLSVSVGPWNTTRLEHHPPADPPWFSSDGWEPPSTHPTAFLQDKKFWLPTTHPRPAMLVKHRKVYFPPPISLTLYHLACFRTGADLLRICIPPLLRLLIHPGWSRFPVLGWPTNTNTGFPSLAPLGSSWTEVSFRGNRTELPSGWLESSPDRAAMVRWRLTEDVTGWRPEILHEDAGCDERVQTRGATLKDDSPLQSGHSPHAGHGSRIIEAARSAAVWQRQADTSQRSIFTSAFCARTIIIITDSSGLLLPREQRLWENSNSGWEKSNLSRGT